MCRKKKRRKRPKNIPNVTSREEVLTISIEESQNSTDCGSWKRIDFTQDSGPAASCTSAAVVNKDRMEPCLVGPTEHTSAPNRNVRFLGKIRPWVQFQIGVCARVKLKVLEGLKKPIFSTSRVAKLETMPVTRLRTVGLLTKGLVRNVGSTIEEAST